MVNSDDVGREFLETHSYSAWKSISGLQSVQLLLGVEMEYWMPSRLNKARSLRAFGIEESPAVSRSRHRFFRNFSHQIGHPRV